MIKLLLPYMYSGMGLAAVTATGIVVLEPEIFTQSPKTEQTVSILSEPENNSDTPSVTKPLEEQPAVEQKIVEIYPEFTLLRVEPDGSTVIAGTGPANTTIKLIDGEVELGSTTTNADGGFVIVLDKPLTSGSHVLNLFAMLENGDKRFSRQSGLINIPESNNGEGPTILIAEAGEATKIVQKPEPEVVKETQVAASNEAAEPEQIEQSTPQPETASVDNSDIPVLIEAADIESGRIFIAGTGKPNASVNLYFDTKLIGTAEIASNGAFLFEGKKEVLAGQYAIRADMFEGKPTNVIARSQVKLIHQPEENLAVSPAAEQPAVQEVASNVVPETPQETDPDQPTVSQTSGVTNEVPEASGDVIPVIRTGTAVIIRRGDSLWRVADRSYGEGIRYTTIFEANRSQIVNPDLIFPGQVFKLPKDGLIEEENSSG
ncbi:MAG: LysM peptidoglycan-binding domain-containing protein [Pseudomonadota bacterium]